MEMLKSGNYQDDELSELVSKVKLRILELANELSNNKIDQLVTNSAFISIGVAKSILSIDEVVKNTIEAIKNEEK